MSKLDSQHERMTVQGDALRWTSYWCDRIPHTAQSSNPNVSPSHIATLYHTRSTMYTLSPNKHILAEVQGASWLRDDDKNFNCQLLSENKGACRNLLTTSCHPYKSFTSPVKVPANEEHVHERKIPSEPVHFIPWLVFQYGVLYVDRRYFIFH